MTTTVQLKRGTRANIDALASSGGLLEGEPLFITDEKKLAVASTNNAYTTAAMLDNNGVVLTPNRPAFHATAGNATLQGNDVTYTTSVFNIGNCLNISNGRFTASITGVYYFRYNQLALNANSGEFRIAIYKNGNGYGGLRYITVKPANSWLSLIAEGHVYLNTNEYVTIRYEIGSGALYADENYGSFSGHFIG